jgi:HEAT repeat protein
MPKEYTHDGNERLRAKAASALGQIGSRASDAIPALGEAMKDEYLNVREAASEALKQIQSADNIAFPMSLPAGSNNE